MSIFEKIFKEIFGINFNSGDVNTYSNYELQKFWNKAVELTMDECLAYMMKNRNQVKKEISDRIKVKVEEPIKHYTIGIDEEWTHLGHDDIIANHLTREEAEQKIYELARAKIVQSYKLDYKKDKDFIEQATKIEERKYFMAEER